MGSVYFNLIIILSVMISSKWTLTRRLMLRFGQTAMSLGRAVGPALGGTIWSWSLGNGLPAPLDAHFLVFSILLGSKSLQKLIIATIVFLRGRPCLCAIFNLHGTCVAKTITRQGSSANTTKAWLGLV